MNRYFYIKSSDFLILLFILTFSFLIDYTWSSLHVAPPAWDQGFHLSQLYRMAYLFNDFNLLDSDWWQKIWSISTTYRGPLTYMISAIFLQFFEFSYRNAILSNFFFNVVFIFSIFYLGRLIKDRSTGLWSSFLCSFTPALLTQRTDYLIDFSLTSIITFTWLIACIWYLNKDNYNYIYSILLGTSIAAIFLIRPTSIFFFWIPALITIVLVGKSLLRLHLNYIFQILLASYFFHIITHPWLSKNWLTILTSLNNARRWGVLYQEGLEANSLDGWLFYPNLIPRMFGISAFLFLIAFTLVYLFTNKRSKRIIFKYSHLTYLWFLSFPIGGLLIAIIMTTKDYRFILPIFPQICILLSILLTTISSYSYFNIYSRIIFISLIIQGLIWNQFGVGIPLTGFPKHSPDKINYWPLDQIVNSIRTANPYQDSTLAVLPDSIGLNAFNLEAEGINQKPFVYSRQIVSNEKSIYNDLMNFDWFIIKSGDQGTMSNHIQEELKNKLLDSSDFFLFDQWDLPDLSQAFLYRRHQASINVLPIECDSSQPNVKFEALKGGSKTIVSGLISKLDRSNLIVTLKGQNDSWRADQPIGEGTLIDDPTSNNCVSIIQQFKLDLPDEAYDSSLIPSISLLARNNNKIILDNIELDLVQLEKTNDKLNQYKLANNHIATLYYMGKLLKLGRFDELFDLVGQTNQSDADQSYLSNGELILLYRLNKNQTSLDDIYALALAQILQIKIPESLNTLSLLTKEDPNNKFVFIAKAVVNLYQFKPKLAMTSINRAESLAQDSESLEILKSLKIVSSLMSFDLVKLFHLSN
ncbi:hypothetical protein [Prochlorococcus marinus]|uniref:hypothetical protein n=1 Tax=Prochlorococcus marinus TaxID=1219 RepID=UPI0022B2D67B|nr:hypothetical protein [Prochlorococcus marinus]